jgi:hypothetical protein
LSLNRHRPFYYWMLVWGLPLLAAFGVLLLGNGFVIGWSTSYDVAVLITSPAQTASPWSAWLLSVTGWLLIPAIAGAVAGHVVSAAISGRRARSIAELLPDEGDE